MAAKQFTDDEWAKINATLRADPKRYGLPQREYGSVLLGSFNIRKMGNTRNRSPETWQFLAETCRSFDLIAVQEIMDNLDGLQRLMSLLGPDFSLVVSDMTGRFPGDPGVGERLGFIYRWNTVERMEVASGITYDRSKVIDSLVDGYDIFTEDMAEYLKKVNDFETGKRKTKPKIKLRVFMSFIRQPFCVTFRIAGHLGIPAYEFMAINAHLYYGNYAIDRRQEFNALTEWILSRLKANTHAYFPNFILLGDLNLDYDNPKTDRERIEQQIKSFNSELVDANVNFPFLDVHPDREELFRTNARLTETFDQIGLFSRDTRLPTYTDNATMGSKSEGPDYGVFEFTYLFSEALLGRPYDELPITEAREFMARFEHKVSDHMPLWIRLPLPVN